MLYQKSVFKATTVDKENHTIEGVFSTSVEDRHGDIVRQNFDLESFNKNPVVLDSHQAGSVLNIIGKAPIVGVVDGALQGTIKFAVEENPIVAQVAFDLMAGGFLNTFSIGFIPKEFNDKGEILFSELLEISAVAVPANQLALAKQKGIDVSPLLGDGIDLVAKEIEESEWFRCKDCDYVGDKETLQDHVIASKMVHRMEPGKPVETKHKCDCVNKKDEKVKTKPAPKTKKKAKKPAYKPAPVKQPTVAEKKKKVLASVVKSIKTFSELQKVETRRKGVRAETNRVLNKTIRELIKVK